jgi:DNA-binding HxlR family transcriptional regulator
MNPEQQKAIESTQHLQEILTKSGLVSRTVFDRSTMKVRYQWTAEGKVFRTAVLKAYEALARTEGANTFRELSSLVAFVLRKR